jgi:hypothetical protein
VNDTLYAAVARELYRAHDEPAAHRGHRRHRALRQGDQRRPVADRPHAAQQPGHLHRPVHADPRADGGDRTAKERGYGPGRFSFNVAGGRCEACQGDGVVKVEMHFLPDVYVPCDVCRGQRYNRETLEVQWKGRNIAQILDMTVEDALRVPEAGAGDRAQAADAAGRGPVVHQAGQAATTLSGGEAQRVKLALELSKRDTGPHALHPGRADHRPALRRHRPAAEGAAPAARRRQHHRRDRAQPGRHQDGRLGDRHGARKAATAAARSWWPARRKRWRPTRKATPAITSSVCSDPPRRKSPTGAAPAVS